MLLSFQKIYRFIMFAFPIVEMLHQVGVIQFPRVVLRISLVSFSSFCMKGRTKTELVNQNVLQMIDGGGFSNVKKISQV